MPTSSVNGNEARATAEKLLGQLQQVRVKLDERIAAVKELASVL